MYFCGQKITVAENLVLIELSAFSGLAGALLTQMVVAANTYFTDQRKQCFELKNLYRNKKVEIGENFCYVTGEKMALIKKNIRYWKNWNDSRRESSIMFLQKEMTRLNRNMEKLDGENWKYNLIHLYFDVSLTDDEIIASNEKTHRLYLRVLDLTDKIRQSADGNKEELYGHYAVAVFEMCSEYEAVYAHLKNDMDAVKKQLLREF